MYPPDSGPPSTRELAEFQGVSPSYVTKLAKAGLITSAEGIYCGFCFVKNPAKVSVWDVVSVLEPDKPLFRCREIRRGIVLFDQKPPRWTTFGHCPIHAAMRDTKKSMRRSLETVALADIANQVGNSIPKVFSKKRNNWFAGRLFSRREPKTQK